MECITLSYMLEENSPVYRGLKKPEIIPKGQISSNGYNSYIITAENHSGTHVDAPGHFIEDGKKISDYLPHELIFNNPLILDRPKKQGELIKLEEISNLDLEGKDCIIFRTGFGKYRNDDPDTYLTFNPGIESNVIYWLRKNYSNIRCIGIDSISISSYQNRQDGVKAHLNAFNKSEEMGKPLLLIEDMKLNNIKKKSSIESLIVVPWQIKGIDSAPCTVLAKMK